MVDLLSHLADAPLANILVLAGLVFLAIGVIGKISGKIEPSAAGRVMAGVLGTVLLLVGIYTHTAADAGRSQNRQPIDRQVNSTQPSTQIQHGSNQCVQGFVWREAGPKDRVCVPPSTREQAREDNNAALSRRANP